MSIRNKGLFDPCREAHFPPWNSMVCLPCEVDRLEAERDRFREALEAILEASPQSYDWYQARARHALKERLRP